MEFLRRHGRRHGPLLPLLILAAGACMLKKRGQQHLRHMRRMRSLHEEQNQLLREIRDALKQNQARDATN